MDKNTEVALAVLLTFKSIASAKLVAQLTILYNGDPRQESWYPGVQILYTEAGGREMHAHTRNVIKALLRLDMIK